MISELFFIRTYNTFWKSLFPGGEDYVRLINAGLGERFAKPISVEEMPARRAIVNSVAFSMFQKVVAKEIDVKYVRSMLAVDTILLDVVAIEAKKLAKFTFHKRVRKVVSEQELAVIKEICQRLCSLYCKKTSLVVAPSLSGCGVLFEAKADIHFSTTLVEVKSGLRSFTLQDLRQLYTYGALNLLDGRYQIDKFELCNPRTGFIWNEYVDIVSENIAGETTVEIYKQIITFVSSENRSL